jgi:molecular chaperone DnaJ
MKNYYEILGIDKDATEEDVKNAYRKAAQLHHPDRNPGDENARERFKEIHEAYEILSDSTKRSRYDRSIFRFQNKPSSKKDGGFSFGFHNTKNDFFGKSSFKGRTITIRLEIELAEAAFGCEKPIKISKRKRCVFCKGLGFKEFISCEQCNGLGFFVITYDAPFETRQNCHFCDGKGKILIKKCDDCQGGMYAKELIEETVNVKIPAGVENGSQLKLPELGEESLRGGSPGDVILNVSIKQHEFFVRDGLNLLVDIPVSFSDLVFGSETKLFNLNNEQVVLKIPAGTQSHSKLRLKNQGLLDMFGSAGDIIATVKCETPKNLEEDYEKVLVELKEVEKKYLGPKKELWIKKIDSKR